MISIINLAAIDFDLAGTEMSSAFGRGRGVMVSKNVSQEQTILLPTSSGAVELPVPCALIKMEQSGTIEIVPLEYAKYWKSEDSVPFISSSAFYPELPEGYAPKVIADWLGKAM